MSVIRHNRNMIEQYMRMLRELQKESLTKWRLQHRLESNYATIDKMIKIGLANGMIYRNDRWYSLTPVGRQFVEGCKVV